MSPADERQGASLGPLPSPPPGRGGDSKASRGPPRSLGRISAGLEAPGGHPKPPTRSQGGGRHSPEHPARFWGHSWFLHPTPPHTPSRPAPPAAAGGGICFCLRSSRHPTPSAGRQVSAWGGRAPGRGHIQPLHPHLPRLPPSLWGSTYGARWGPPGPQWPPPRSTLGPAWLDTGGGGMGMGMCVHAAGSPIDPRSHPDLLPWLSQGTRAPFVPHPTKPGGSEERQIGAVPRAAREKEDISPKGRSQRVGVGGVGSGWFPLPADPAWLWLLRDLWGEKQSVW